MTALGPTKPDAIELFLDLERWTLEVEAKRAGLIFGQVKRGPIFQSMPYKRQLSLTERWTKAGWFECGSPPGGWLTPEGLAVAAQIRAELETVK